MDPVAYFPKKFPSRSGCEPDNVHAVSSSSYGSPLLSFNPTWGFIKDVVCDVGQLYCFNSCQQKSSPKASFHQFLSLNMAPLPEGVAKSLEETKVDYKLVGNSGLRVSVPIIGCMSIGNPEWANWVAGPEKALPLLKAAYDRGINTVCLLLSVKL